LINTIPSASAPTAGLVDRRHEMGLRRGIDLINARVLGAADRSGRIVVIDTDQALAELPLSRHIEPKLWFYGRIAYSADATRALARALAQAWGLLQRGPIKVVAVDLDNTLWGGVYGDDGVEACVWARLPRQCILGDAAGMPSAEESGAAAGGAEQEQRRCDHSL
jgi:predicted enzyme involved in methoxymalonyl-ACP biosynthesis